MPILNCHCAFNSSKLNGHVRRATAVRARSMLTGVSNSLAGISHMAGLLIATVWALALVILLLAFILLLRERHREFAALRLLGTSRARLCGLVLGESAICSLLGGLLGVAAAAAVVFPFARLIELRLGLPYLAPGPGEVAVLTGRSGSEKTTLLHMLAGLLMSTEGEAYPTVGARMTLSKVTDEALLEELLKSAPKGFTPKYYEITAVRSLG